MANPSNQQSSSGHRPNQSLVIVVNADGGGYVKQFDTLAEAKAEFKAATTDGVAYLYQPATKSLSSKPAGSPAPISSTGSTETVNGVEKKGMSFSPFDNNQFTDILSSVFLRCSLTTKQDIDGVYQVVPILPVHTTTYVNGVVTEREVYKDVGKSPCFLPDGFALDFGQEQDSPSRETKTINSLSYDGNIYGPYFEVSYLLNFKRSYIFANGSGGTRQGFKNGLIFIENNIVTWENYVDGDAPYKVDNFSFPTIKTGHPIPNGRYLITYKVAGDERTHSGAWVVRIKNASSAIPSVTWKFEPEDPTQPPPPPCSITKKQMNSFGVVEDICDPDIVYPFSVFENCADPLEVQIEGANVTLGTNTKRGMNDGYGNVTWGQCTGMVYVPNGQQVYEGTDYYYYSNGNGWYYSESKTSNCPASGTSIGRTTTDLTVSINDGTYIVGYQHEDTIADGNCGSSGIEISSQYISSGTYLTEDSNYRYYSNGTGSYYTEDVNAVPPYGTELSSDSGNYTVDVGCGSFTTGTYSSTTYADGMGGTYTSGGNNYYSYGTSIGNCNDYNYYADGNGGSYQGEYTGGGGSGYPSYGTPTGNSGGNSNQIEINGSYYSNGGSSYTEYHDGMGGYYTESSSSYEPYGYNFTTSTYYDSDMMTDVTVYYNSDGNGGYYTTT